MDRNTLRCVDGSSRHGIRAAILPDEKTWRSALKKAIIFGLAAALFLSLGCTKEKPEDNRSAQMEALKVKRASLIDPVDGKPVEDYLNAKWTYVYKQVEYRFNSEENYKKFKKDPEKYIKEE
jgi:YHS domain-containing protein